MAIAILSPSQVERMRRAGRAAAETLAFIGTQLRPGMPTLAIDRLVREDTERRGAQPSQLGYQGFPAAVCTSRNDVVCHGIPSAREILVPGDIVNVDVTSYLDGYHGDTSATFVVGEATEQAKHIVDVARRCRDAGIAVIRDGARLGDTGAAIEELAHKEGVTVVREIGGHGIGRRMHADPHVPHTGTRGAGVRLKAGMAITVEPMVNVGGAEVRLLDDGWTIVTADGGLSAQWEHTVVAREGHETTTLLRTGRACRHEATSAKSLDYRLRLALLLFGVTEKRVLGGVVHKLPPDLREALRANASALAAWTDITPLARNEFICWVEDAKQPVTRARRIRRTQEELEEGQRRPCCWPGCKHRERAGK